MQTRLIAASTTKSVPNTASIAAAMADKMDLLTRTKSSSAAASMAALAATSMAASMAATMAACAKDD